MEIKSTASPQKLGLGVKLNFGALGCGCSSGHDVVGANLPRKRTSAMQPLDTSMMQYVTRAIDAEEKKLDSIDNGGDGGGL